MKKSLLILLFTLFILSNCFSFEYNLYDYIGKKVMIFTEQTIYIGIVEGVEDIRICQQHDNIGNCLVEKVYWTVFLRNGTDNIVLRSGDIIDVKEFEE